MYRVANVAVGRAVITSGTVQHVEIGWKARQRGVIVPVVDDTVAVKRFFSEPGSDRVEIQWRISHLDSS